jgi:hypothetical protein
MLWSAAPEVVNEQVFPEATQVGLPKVVQPKNVNPGPGVASIVTVPAFAEYVVEQVPLGLPAVVLVQLMMGPWLSCTLPLPTIVTTMGAD